MINFFALEKSFLIDLDVGCLLTSTHSYFSQTSPPFQLWDSTLQILIMSWLSSPFVAIACSILFTTLCCYCNASEHKFNQGVWLDFILLTRVCFQAIQSYYCDGRDKNYNCLTTLLKSSSRLYENRFESHWQKNLFCLTRSSQHRQVDPVNFRMSFHERDFFWTCFDLKRFRGCFEL